MRFKIFVREKRVLLAAMLLCLLAALALRLPARIGQEVQARQVGAVMLLSDVAELAAESEMSLDDWLSAFGQMGLSGVIVTAQEAENETLIRYIRDSGLSPLLMGGDPALIGEGFLPMYIAQDGIAAETLLPALTERDIALVLVENRYQTGPELPQGYEEVLTDYDTDFVKCFWLNHTFRARYAVLGYTGAEEIENILYRAATDRTVRLLWCAPFVHDGQLITDPAVYAQVFDSLEARIAAQGLSFGEGISVSEPFAANRIGLIAGGMCVVLAGVLLLLTLLRLHRRVTLAITLLGCAGCIVLAICFPGFAMKLFAFGAACIFPCLAVFLALSLLRDMYGCGEKLHRLCLRFLGILAAMVATALLGGLLVGAILADRRYMLELELFSGVKVSQLLPLLYAVLIAFKLIYHERGRSLRGDLRAMLASIAHKGRIKLIVIAVALVAAVVIFILRTGDGMLGVPEFEQQIRNFLENNLYARPRTKEMFIAFPATGLAVLAASRGWKNGILPLGVLLAIGCASVCNTFCHIRAELLLSLIRTLIGFGIGYLLGAIGLLAVGAVIPRPRLKTDTGAR